MGAVPLQRANAPSVLKSPGARAQKTRTIRIAMHGVEQLNTIPMADRRLVTELGRERPVIGLAEVTGVDPGDVERIRRAALEPVSLENPVGEKQETELGHLIDDRRRVVTV
jgi:RNA polymerase primary sigma factor